MANETILVVDADLKSQKVLEVSFKKAGYRVILTASRREAIQRLGTDVPELILCDTTLPDGDGFAFCEQLKHNPNFADIPVMFLTEDDALSQKMRAFEIGAAEYLTKPIYIKEVISRVELLLQRRAKVLLNDGEAEQVEGDLDDITMIDLLQNIERELRSGTITLERKGTQASLFFREGNILDASCGKLQGEEAIYRLMLWPSGRFLIQYHDLVRRADHIEKDATALLMEGMRRLDRWNEMVVTLPNLNRAFEADYQRLPELSRDWPAEVGRIVRLFDGYRTLRDVIDDSPLDDITTLRIIRKLLDEDVLLDVTPSEAALSSNAQQTNLASWLTARTVRHEDADSDADPALFSTSPGQQHVPGLLSPSSETESAPTQPTRAAPAQPDEAPEPVAAEPLVAPAPVEPAAPSLEELSRPETREYEEGQAPKVSTDTITQWQFHWDKERGEAVARPRPERSVEDTFEIDKLMDDLSELERMRQEEEARRLAAEQQAREQVSGQFPVLEPSRTVPRDADAAPEPQRASDPDDDGYVSRESTKELHRNAVLAEIEAHRQRELDRERERTPLAMPVQHREEGRDARDPLAEVADMLPPSARRAHAELSPEAPSREAAVAESESIAREAAATARQDDIDTLDQDRPLTPLGAPEDQDEPRVSEEDVRALKERGESPSARAAEPDYTLEEVQPPADDEGQLDPDEDEDEDFEDEEDGFGDDDEDDDDELEPALDASGKQRALPISQRTAQNYELVSTQVSLKKDTSREAASPSADAEGVAPKQAQEEVVAPEVAAAALAVSAPEPVVASSSEAAAAAVPVPNPEVKADAAPVVEPEPAALKQERYEDIFGEPPPADGFNRKGLLAVVGVIVAVLLLFVFVLPKLTGPQETPQPPNTIATQPATTPVAVVPEPPQTAPATAALEDMDAQAAADMAMDQALNDAQAAAADDMAQGAGAAQAALVADLADQVATPEPEPTPEPTPEPFEARLSRASALVTRESFSGARKLLRELAKEQPDSAEVIGLLGSAEVGMGNHAAGLSSLTKARAKGYKSERLLLDLGTAYQLTGDEAKAKKAYQDFLSAYPNSKNAAGIRALVSRL